MTTIPARSAWKIRHEHDPEKWIPVFGKIMLNKV